MDSRQWNGEDDRDGLTQRSPNSPATIAPSCQRCGFVVYKVGARVPGGILCQSCAEAQKVEAA